MTFNKTQNTLKKKYLRDYTIRKRLAVPMAF